MADAVTDMKLWFEKLNDTDKRAVVAFLYDRALLREGQYVGPRPGLVTETRGLHVGPVPVASTNVCPSCGRAY